MTLKKAIFQRVAIAGKYPLCVGSYDYGTIMHYPPDAFSVNGKDTIVPKANVQIGQRVRLSAGDIAAITATLRMRRPMSGKST